MYVQDRVLQKNRRKFSISRSEVGEERSNENERSSPIDPKGFNTFRIKMQNENKRALIKRGKSAHKFLIIILRSLYLVYLHRTI